ncbi:MAG: NERD domain-containing protein [Chloroflexi bacterium]|nr:NERD domain-containing protein [Chloroflexota bacterium]
MNVIPLSALDLSIAAILVLALVHRWRHRRRDLEETLRSIAVDSMQDILLPDGMGGQIHLQHVLLTAKGLVVVEINRIKGVVFASDRMDEWTVISRARRFSFHNPQPALYDRVAALKVQARDLPVTGHILFSEEADFSKSRPTHVIFPDELRARYRKPARAELDRLMEAFYPHWEKVQQVTEPAPR